MDFFVIAINFAAGFFLGIIVTSGLASRAYHHAVRDLEHANRAMKNANAQLAQARDLWKKINAFKAEYR